MLKDEDIEMYLPYFDGEDIPREQKIEKIKALHNIMQTFVDQAFDQPISANPCDRHKGNAS